MTITAKIITIDDKFGFILPEEVVSELALDVGDQVTFTVVKTHS